MNKAKDPVVRVSVALKKAGGNKAALGRVLGYGRAHMTEVCRVYSTLPPLMAHRAVKAFGTRIVDKWEDVGQ